MITVIARVARGLFDFLVPRFVTEDVIVVRDESGQNIPLCPVGQEQDEDHIVGIITAGSLSWLGYAWFPRYVSEMREYEG